MRTLIDRTKTARSTRSTLLFGALAAVLSLSGCSMTVGGLVPDSAWMDAIPRGFDFANAHVIEVSLDVSIRVTDDVDGLVKVQPYAGEIGAYSPNEDGSYTLLGSMTLGADGKGQLEVLVPNSLATVTIRPSTFGLFEREVTLLPDTTSLSLVISPDDSAASIASKALDDRSEEVKNSESGSRGLVTVGTSPYKYLSTYDSNGVPAGLESTRESFSLGFLNDITTTLPEYQSLPASHPTYLDSQGLSNMALTEDAEVMVTFVNEGAGYRNPLGYFTYKTADGAPKTAPTADKVVIAFPNTSYVGSGGGLQSGDRIKLQNPDGSGTQFKAGTSIGWVIMADGFNGKVTDGQARYYSIPSLNPEAGSLTDKTHVAFLLYDKPAKHKGSVFLLGFEDLNRKTADNDFNDVLFSISVTPTSSVSSKGVAVVADAGDSDGDGVIDSLDQYPSDPLRSSSAAWPSATSYGTALFEDLWPSLGDYDFNDIVSSLRVTTVKNAAGMAVESIIELRLKAAGSGLPSGLALSLPVASTSISSVTGQSLTNKVFTPGANGVEADGSSSIVPIFSDSHVEFGVSGQSDLLVNTVAGGVTRTEKSYTIKVSYLSGLSASKLAVLPDLFTVVGGDRGKEVHAIGKVPSGKASLALFNTKNDASSKASGQYYRSTAGAPWALLVPADIPWAIERVEFSKAYLKFGAWVKSGGKSSTDWYLDLPGYRNTGLLHK